MSMSETETTNQNRRSPPFANFSSDTSPNTNRSGEPSSHRPTSASLTADAHEDTNSGTESLEEAAGGVCGVEQKEELVYKMEASGNAEMDRFLQKLKSDRMFELRNIEHGEKPVTGQNHREQIQKFMEENIVVDGAAGASQPSMNAEIQRPEAVVVEVQGIIEQRRVSSVLQSAAFRRQLENVIRGSIQSTQRQVNPTPRPRIARSSVNASAGAIPRARARVLPAETSLPSRPQRQNLVPPAQEIPSLSLPRLRRQDSSDSISSEDSFSSARSSADADDFEDEVDEAGMVPDARNDSSLPESNPERILSQPVDQQASNVQGRNRHNNSDTGMENLTWNDISRVHREELVEEISDLLHSRLVSSTLDGEFRATLELLVQDRVAASGTNGRQVQETIRNLPPSGIVQNDFTHLGIPNPDADNSDNISITGISAHSVPYNQTNTHLGREIHSLKSQIMEMKNMIKLTFDLQMDIQRAIRQEVAAAMQTVTAQGATVAPVRPSVPVNDTHCIICLDNHSDSVLYQCGHMCVCYMCGKSLISRNLGCPVCRAPIKDIIRAYKTNVE